MYDLRELTGQSYPFDGSVDSRPSLSSGICNLKHGNRIGAVLEKGEQSPGMKTSWKTSCCLRNTIVRERNMDTDIRGHSQVTMTRWFLQIWTWWLSGKPVWDWAGVGANSLLNYICELKETYLKSVMMESSSGLFTSDNLRWEMQMSLSVTACQSWTYCYAVIRATISSGFMFSLFLTVRKHDVRSVTVPARGVRAARYILWIHSIPVNRSKVSLGKKNPQDWISLR